MSSSPVWMVSNEPSAPFGRPHGPASVRLGVDRRLPALGGRAVSEYRYYEFVALDRPLTTAEQAEVRELSTRATITATSFVNEYQWGDFKGSPDELGVAAEASPPLPEAKQDPSGLDTHIAGIPASEKDRLLGLVATGQATRARVETSAHARSSHSCLVRSRVGAPFFAGHRVEPGDATELAEVSVGRHDGEAVLAGQRG
jgi:hypothetical protein